MSKLGFEIPRELDERLRRHVAWGSKGKVIEGLLRLMVEDLERGDSKLHARALLAYWHAHK